ncbi:MAG: hypothetical protein AAF533_28460 [Acidobacteriota bacterium]
MRGLETVRRCDDVDEATFARIEAIVAAHVDLPAVMRWCVSQAPPRDLDEVVVQDEYTHDVVLGIEGDVFVVYEST